MANNQHRIHSNQRNTQNYQIPKKFYLIPTKPIKSPKAQNHNPKNHKLEVLQTPKSLVQTEIKIRNKFPKTETYLSDANAQS